MSRFLNLLTIIFTYIMDELIDRKGIYRRWLSEAYEYGEDIMLSNKPTNIWESARDMLWMLAAFILRPFVRTKGTVERRCFARALRISPPLYGIEVRHVETCTVNDGKNVLRATLWLPKGATGPFPTVIIRTPYGAQSEQQEWGQMILCERGYAVLLQDTRGRFGSDGDFIPVEHEREDGCATVRWARTQPWCDGRVGVTGVSYLGFTAWAAIGACDEGELQAAVPTITQAVVKPAVFLDGGAVALELLVLWFYLIEVVVLFGKPVALARNVLDCWRRRRLSTATMVEPLEKLDSFLFGRPVAFFQAGVREPAGGDGPFWSKCSTLCELRPNMPECVAPPPIHIVTGLQDFFAPQALLDYARAAQLQPNTRLTIAPYAHWDFVTLTGYQIIMHATMQCIGENMPLKTFPPSSPQSTALARRAAAAADAGSSSYPPPCDWLSPGRSAAERALPVQACFLGSNRWRGFAVWPPAAALTASLQLTAGRKLAWRSTGHYTSKLEDAYPPSVLSTRSADNAPCSEEDARATTARHHHEDKPSTLEYVYRPGAPTPSAGGASFNPLNSGSVGQRSIERRADLLVFTTAPLHSPLCLAGQATLKVRLWASARSVDVVARLCLVDANGNARSTNLCEGLTRVCADADEASIGAAGNGNDGTAAATTTTTGRLVTVQIGPLAAELSEGERLRLHVCSAAHPRWMRSLCADPAIPLHEQRANVESCKVRIGVDDCESVLMLPTIDAAKDVAASAEV